jgi:cytochrome P450
MNAEVASIDLVDLAPFSASAEHGLFNALRNDDRLHFNDEPDGPGFWSLVRYDHVSEAARDNRHFLSGQGTQIKNRRAEGHGHASVHNSDPPLHGKLRNIVLPSLARSAVMQREGRIREIAIQLLEAAPCGESFDFVERIAVKLPMMVIADVLGVPPNDSEALVDWANLMSDVRASNDEQAAARAELYHYFRGLGAHKRQYPADDVASALVAADMHEEALDAYFMLLTVAGNETTRFLLTGGLAQLSRQPEDYGTSVPAGAKVVLWFSSANRDERQFADPDRLVIDRKPNHHLGFGQGPHFCVGAHLARLEANIFIDAMLDRVTDFDLVGEPERLPSNWFTGWTSMQVRWS